MMDEMTPLENEEKSPPVMGGENELTHHKTDEQENSDNEELLVIPGKSNTMAIIVIVGLLVTAITSWFIYALKPPKIEVSPSSRPIPNPNTIIPPSPPLLPSFSPRPTLPPELKNSKRLAPPPRVTPPTTIIPSQPKNRITIIPSPPSSKGNTQPQVVKKSVNTNPSQVVILSPLSNSDPVIPQNPPQLKQNLPSPSTPTGEERIIPSPTPSTSLFDVIPQVTEARVYFQQHWKPPQGLSQNLEYRLEIGKGGTVESIAPLSRSAVLYLDRTSIPLKKEKLVSPLSQSRPIILRLVLEPTGAVRTFLEDNNQEE